MRKFLIMSTLLCSTLGFANEEKVEDFYDNCMTVIFHCGAGTSYCSQDTDTKENIYEDMEIMEAYFCP